MNELATLNNLVTEIKFFENQAVSSYWEIGKRLAQAKEQVEHGEWESWLKDNLNYSYSMSKKLIKVYKEFPKGQLIADLNFSQMLALTSVNEETREEILENENLEEKTVRETNEIVKKYKELEKKNKELEEDVEVLSSESEFFSEQNKALKEANKMLSDEVSKKEVVTETIEKIVEKEVIPTDYESIKRENKKLQERNKKLELDLRVSKLNDNEENEKIKSEIRNYKWLVVNFVKNTTPLLNLVDQIKLLPNEEQELIKKSTENLLGFASNLYEQMKGL